MTTGSFSFLNEPVHMTCGVGCQIKVELYVEQLLFLLKGEYPMKDRITLRLSQVIRVINLHFFFCSKLI